MSQQIKAKISPKIITNPKSIGVSMTSRQKMIDGLDSMTQETITASARKFGKMRMMSEAEIEENLTALEDEVIRHLQIEQAIRLSGDFYV
jgi:hypothetical protein